MEQDRRTFLTDAGRWLLLTGAAAIAWDHVVAGSPEGRSELRRRPPLVGHDRRHREVHRLWHVRRRLQGGERRAARAGLLPYWVERLRDRSRGFSSTPSSTLRTARSTGFPESIVPSTALKVFFVPKLCNHCAHSPCVQVCPIGATFESPDGVVLVDSSRCLGCRYCVQACPYGCRFIDPRTQTADKCTLCYHRITQGLTTACCETCPTGARQLVDLKDPAIPSTSSCAPTR